MPITWKYYRNWWAQTQAVCRRKVPCFIPLHCIYKCIESNTIYIEQDANVVFAPPLCYINSTLGLVEGERGSLQINEPLAISCTRKDACYTVQCIQATDIRRIQAKRIYTTHLILMHFFVKNIQISSFLALLVYRLAQAVVPAWCSSAMATIKGTIWVIKLFDALFPASDFPDCRLSRPQQDNIVVIN